MKKKQYYSPLECSIAATGQYCSYFLCIDYVCQKTILNLKTKTTHKTTTNCPGWLRLFFIMKCHKMLCVHCAYIVWILAQKKPQEILPLQQRAKPPEIRCVRYRYTAVKMSQSKGFFTNPLAINDYLGYHHSLTWKYKKRREVKLVQGFFNSSLPEF